MVTRYGMSSIGPCFEDNNNEQILWVEMKHAISDRIDARKYVKLLIIVNKRN
jgi:hypothetical protein